MSHITLCGTHDIVTITVAEVLHSASFDGLSDLCQSLLQPGFMEVPQ
jgi:hypothetical protein